MLRIKEQNQLKFIQKIQKLSSNSVLNKWLADTSDFMDKLLSKDQENLQ
jgi:hypothetical protein